MGKGYTTESNPLENPQLEESILQYFQGRPTETINCDEIVAEFYNPPITIPTIHHSLSNLMARGKLRNLFNHLDGNSYVFIG